jgi:hypothetical protein
MNLPISFRPKDFGSAMWDMIRGKGTGYTIKGNIDVNTPFGHMKIPICKEGGTTRLKKGDDDDDNDEVYVFFLFPIYFFYQNVSINVLNLQILTRHLHILI